MKPTVDFAAMTGLQQLQHALIDHPSAGITTLTDMRINELEHGRVVFSITPNHRMTNPLGTIHGGIAATLLDSVASCAVHSALPVGASYATTQLNIHYTGVIRPDTKRITGVGDIVHHGRRIATATGTITDNTDRIVAHGTVTCSITGATKTERT